MSKNALYVSNKPDGEFKLHKIFKDYEQIPQLQSGLYYALLVDGHSLFGRLVIDINKKGGIQ